MKIKSKHLAPIILAFFVIGIAVTMFFNMWNTSSQKIPARYRSGEFAGQYDPSDIRGSYSLEDINSAFNIPIEDMAMAFGFADTPNPAMIKAKDIEKTYGKQKQGDLGTDSMRLFVAYYSGLPYTPEEGTLLPEPAISILHAKANLTEEQIQELKEITVSLPKMKPLSAKGSGKSSEGHGDEGEFKMRGRTTFKELLDYGITQEEIENILNLPMGRTGETVRDYVFDNEMQFSAVKPKFDELVESKKANHMDQ